MVTFGDFLPLRTCHVIDKDPSVFVKLENKAIPARATDARSDGCVNGCVTVHKVNQLSRGNLWGESVRCCFLVSTPQRPLKYT